MLLNATQTGTHWGPHGRRVLNLLATRGPTSREKVHRLTGLHRNLVGDAVRRLIDDGLVRSGKPEVTGRGRPRVPLDLDPARRSLIGIAVTPQTVSACSVNLCREAIVEPIHLATGGDPLRTAAGAIGSLLGDQTLAIGMSITGVIDTAHGVMLESSSVAHGSTSLAPLHSAAGALPLVIENDLHALALYHQFHHAARWDEDTLLVRLEDGAVGGALIINGRPHTGCLHAASEVGHTSLAIETRRCYCGRRGCLERVFDSDFARDLDGQSTALQTRLAPGTTGDATTRRIARLVGIGIANAVQLVKPHRLVLVSHAARQEDFRARLGASIAEEILPSLRQRVRVEWWDDPGSLPAVVAAYPALALILGKGADDSNDCAARPTSMEAEPTTD
jgi:predicted NBD/HSP70 family sugar kinase